MSKSRRKHWKLQESVLTNTWSRCVAKMPFIWGFVSILIMFFESTKCFLVLELIGFRLEWEEHMENLLELLLELTSTRSWSRFESRKLTKITSSKLWDDQSSSSLEDSTSSCPRSGVSRNGILETMKPWEQTEDSSLTASTASIVQTEDHSRSMSRFRENSEAWIPLLVETVKLWM